MIQSSMLSVGLDVHPEPIAVASVGHAHGAAVVFLGTIGTRPCDLDNLIRPLHAKATPRVFVYDAGPCGSGLSRDLTTRGPDGGAVAPSLIPTNAGDRVTTDRRDARPLARRRRSGDLPPVAVPQVDDDARRALSRARAESLRALQAATSRLKAFLLRQDSRDTGQANGRPAPLRGLADVVGPTPAQQIVFQAYGRAVTEHTARRQRREQALQERVQTWRLAPVVKALQALRGVQCTVAVTTVAALGDLTRLPSPQQLRRELGLTPSDYSRGPRRPQGGIPKTGHSHARRALSDGAWADRYPATGRRPLQRRLAHLPTPIQDLRWQAPARLGKRYRHLMARGKNAHQVVVAMAREWVALMWAMARDIPLPA